MSLSQANRPLFDDSCHHLPKGRFAIAIRAQGFLNPQLSSHLTHRPDSPDAQAFTQLKSKMD